MQNIDITPNAAKLIESLRYLTYTNETAIADIVDNSFDAEADNVIVSIDKNDSIIIHDDGHGMDKKVMGEAIKLGSNTQKEQTDLGRFGMGLVTASISMGRRVEVISKMEDEEPHKVVLDLDHIIDTQQWYGIEEPLTEEEAKTYAKLEHGTTVKISKVDSIKSNIGTLVANHLRLVFRSFLQAGKTITVNGQMLTPIDPLSRDLKDTLVLYDDDIEYEGEKVHIVVAHLNTSKSDIEAKYDDENHIGIGQRKQGFYVVRNNREIAEAETLGLYDKHPSKNRFRCEISYSGDLDSQFGINFTKNRININQGLGDKIKAIVTPLINMIAKQGDVDAKVKSSEKVDHNDAESIIKRKKSLLNTQNTWKEKRKSPKHKDPDEEKTTTEVDTDEEKKRRKREKIKTIQPGKNAMPAEFREVKSGALSPMFNCYFEGNRIVIEWNIQHPFHEKMIARYSDEKNIITPVDLLVYSMAQEQLAQEEGSLGQQAVDSAIENMSRNLRILMQ